VSEIHIAKRPLVDVYVSPQQFRSAGSSAAFYVTVKEVPLMNLVRLGIGLLLVGGILIFVFDPGTKDDW
jgi:cytochrome c biogenesis factor